MEVKTGCREAWGWLHQPQVHTPPEVSALGRPHAQLEFRGTQLPLWDTRGIVALIQNHRWEIREWLLVSGSYGNRPQDKDPSARVLDIDSRKHWGRSREVNL